MATIQTPVRERIIAATAELLSNGGSDAVSTRAVAAAASVQAPTLYRLFGDKQGLLDAVAAYGFEQYLAKKKAMATTDDPLQDLRRGWNNHIEFGLTYPAFYMLMYGPLHGTTQPRQNAASAEAHRLLLGLLERVAAVGRLRMPPEAAANLIQAASIGVTFTLIGTPPDERDANLAAQVREIVFTAITTETNNPISRDTTIAAQALALDVALTNTASPLTSSETALLRDWLHRLAISNA